VKDGRGARRKLEGYPPRISKKPAGGQGEEKLFRKLAHLTKKEGISKAEGRKKAAE